MIEFILGCIAYAMASFILGSLIQRVNRGYW